MQRVEHAVEILDRPIAAGERAASLADVDRLNAWFGGHALTLSHVKRALRRLPADRQALILDAGTGSAGLAVRLVRWARRHRRPVRVIALDTHATAAARRAAAQFDEITLVLGDAGKLPVARGKVDLVVSELLLHHLAPDVATRALREMAAVARAGFIVNDLWRSRLAVILVWLATRILGCHPISRHDGPLSVRRSYSPDEIRGLAARARLSRIVVHRYPWLLRVVAVGAA